MSDDEKAFAADWVWAPDDHDVYVAGRIIEESGNGQCIVELDNGEERHHPKRALIPMKQSSLQRIVGDLTLLDEMSVPLILHCLRKRFEAGKIYSAIGTILISINPYTQLDLYTPKMIRKYRNSLEEHREVPPHVFVVADQAYKGLTFDKGPNQSIVISGESGAGKTEATKQCLSYLGAVAGSVAGVERKVFDANPILEGFGNAKTVRNNNSSRFGKYVEIYMNRHLQLMGGKTTNYLLEKVRCDRQGEGERNYHFFYMLTRGCDRSLRQELELQTPEKYRICTEGNCVKVPGINDKNDFEEVRQAFVTLQFDPKLVHSIYRFIAGILHLGNVTFDVKKSSFADDTSTVSKSSLSDLKKCAKCWKIDAKKLEKSITHRALVMPGNKTVESGLNPIDANSHRGSLVKFVYSKLFDWLVQQINKSMEPKTKVYKSIGLLDIFGFEIFQKNSLEQLCINFCNEKLQQLFNFTVFKLEERVYKSENIGVDHVPFIDNQPILDLIEKKPKAVLPMLDEEAIIPGGSEDKWRGKIMATFGSHKYFRKYPQDDSCFVLSHYAGDVVYDTTNFMEKNKDVLDAGLLILLDQAKEPILNTLFSKKGGKSMSAGKRKMTLSAQFRTQLNKLMTTLQATQPHYIRCIKPNDEKEPLYFVPKNCFEQMTYSGVFEAVKIRKGGFPFRLKHVEFVTRYKCILEEDKVGCSSGKRGCQDIVNHLKLNRDNVREGKTMLFYRAMEHRVLELKRNIIMEKRKMNQTLKELINTNPDSLDEPELFYERLARAVRACKRYNIESALSEKAKKLLDTYIESRIDATTKNLLNEAIEEKDLDKLERVCAIIEREQYETDKCKLALRMRDRIKLINRESEKAVVTLDTNHMEACLFAATELDFTNDYIDYFRWMFDSLGKDSEKFVQEQMRQAVKMNDSRRQLRLNIKLKDLVFDKLGQAFTISNCPILKECEDWAAEKLLGREKSRQNMMLWTNGEIHSHLTTMDKKYKKEGKELFKQIQIYMTDRENRNKSQDEEGLEVVCMGHDRKEFRDEIYCQLIKQLTNNPGSVSNNRGWNLLNICLYVFPPSRELENYLEVFIRNQPRERKERSMVALQSILYSANAGMRNKPTLKDMQDILNGIRPVKRDFLDEAPAVPAWAPLTVSFNDIGDEADEYFESANEPLAGSVAPQPKLVNNKPLRKTLGGHKGAPQNMATQFNFGKDYGKSTNAPPMNPIQEQQQQSSSTTMGGPPLNPIQQKAQQFGGSKASKQQKQQSPQQQRKPKPAKEEKKSDMGPGGGGGDGDYQWLCHLDAESGEVFYERISDGKTTWDRPNEPVKPHWLAHMDVDSGELYFENIDTGETQWEKPEEFSDPDEKWIAHKDPESGDYYYENIETQKTQWETPKCFQEKMPEQEWLRHFDPTSGEYYYENVKSGQTTWDPPQGVNFN